MIRQDAGPQFQEQRRAFGIGEVRILVDQARLLAEPDHPDDAFDAIDVRPTHPTAPSRLTSSSFLASTANSIGNSRNTCRQKPSTIIETASSSPIPRDRQ